MMPAGDGFSLAVTARKSIDRIDISAQPGCDYERRRGEAMRNRIPIWFPGDLIREQGTRGLE
jgi:hypothetical protein